jgi:hypothetical protein
VRCWQVSNLCRISYRVGRRRQAMPSWAEMLCNKTIGGEEPLGLPCRLEPLHALLPLAASCEARRRQAGVTSKTCIL